MTISNARFGSVRWTGEQWVGADDVRYGRFISTRMGISVNLPLDDVVVQK